MKDRRIPLKWRNKKKFPAGGGEGGGGVLRKER